MPLIIFIWLLILSVMCDHEALAGSFEVAPTTIHLSPGARSGVFYIVNRGSQPVIAQTEAVDWDQSSMSDHFTSSATLLVSPPMVRLMPGQRQTVRLAIAPESQAGRERAFRLLVSELPDPAAQSEQGVQVLLQFSVPVFIDAPKKTPPQLEWSVMRGDQGMVLVAHNNGDHHAKLSGVSLTLPDNQQLALAPNSFSYILADASHAWPIATTQPLAGHQLTLIAQDENDGAVNASIFVPR